MNHAVIYTRVSTQEQAADNHHSLAAQLHLCRKAAQERDYQVVGHFEDAGRSATSMKRPGLQDLLVYCEQNSTVRAVFVQDTDRLARNTYDHLALRALFSRRNIKLISVSQPMVEDSAEGQLIDTIIASVNQFQSDLTARKVLKGMEQKARSGGWPGKAPVGYKNVLVNQKHLVRPDPKTAPAVQEAFRRYSSGHYTLADIADLIAASGVRTRKGQSLHPFRVRQMLENPFYIGRIRWGQLRADGTHPPLVSHALFAEVAQRMTQRGYASPRAHIHSFLLRGLLVCGQCGGRVIGEHHPKKGKSYYRCHTRGCGPCLPVPRAEERLRTIVESVHFSEQFLQSLYLQMVEESDLAEGEAASKRAVALNQKKGLLARQRTLDQKLMAGTVRDEEYRRIQDQLLMDLETVEDQLARLAQVKRPRLDLFERVSEIVLHLPGFYSAAPDGLKRLYVTLFWTEFIVENGDLTPRPSELLAGLLEARDGLVDPGIPPRRRGILPPPASRPPVIPGSSSNGREGAPNRRSSNRLFGQFTFHFESLAAHLDQLSDQTPTSLNHSPTLKHPTFPTSSKEPPPPAGRRFVSPRVV